MTQAMISIQEALGYSSIPKDFWLNRPYLLIINCVTRSAIRKRDILFNNKDIKMR